MTLQGQNHSRESCIFFHEKGGSLGFLISVKLKLQEAELVAVEAVGDRR